jgi:glycosyltransferase involved in cell wall biosynthesis
MSFGIHRPRRVGIDVALASSTAPGTARHVAEQARALLRLDVPWTWVPQVASETNPLYQALIEHGLKPQIVPGSKISTRMTFRLGRAWAESGCDLGFATGFAPWRSCPIVMNFFDSNIYEYGWTWVQTGRRTSYYINYILGLYALRRARRLFVNSQHCVDYLARRFPFAAAQLRLTPPGITPPRDAAHDQPPAALRNLEKPYCLYVGVFSENKNQRRLMEAWGAWQKSDPNAPVLLLVGRCDDDYYQAAIEPVWRSTSRPDEIVFLKNLTEHELAWTYRHAGLYIQPSFAEGFGLPIVEAMSYGLPVAASKTTSLPEAGGDAAVYFDPASVDSILVTVRDLWRSPAHRADLAAHGVQRPALFTWERNATTIAKEIEEVLKKL